MQNTYWNNNGTYEAEAQKLSELVPMMGECETFKGEVFRAATKIYYDYYNNGFGNFWKEPAAFLMTHVALPEAVKDMLFQHANGNMHHGSYDEEIELMMDTVVVALRDIEDRPNDVDMWEFKPDWKMEREFWEEEVEEDDWDYEEEDY
jgi:hypothetical protein